MTSSCQPQFTITNRMTSAINRIERFSTISFLRRADDKKPSGKILFGLSER